MWLFHNCFATFILARLYMMGVTAVAGVMISVAMLTRLGGDCLECSGWLPTVLQWAGLLAPPMSVRLRTVVFFWSGEKPRDRIWYFVPGYCEQFCSGYPTGSGRLPAGRSGVDFTVQLDVPWHAPEVFVNMESAGLYELNTESMLDLLGLRARQPGVAVIHVMTGRDSRSVRALVPDGKVLGRGFHDVTLVDMDHNVGPDVPVAELGTLRLMWPVPVVSGMSDL